MRHICLWRSTRAQVKNQNGFRYQPKSCKQLLTLSKPPNDSRLLAITRNTATLRTSQAAIPAIIIIMIILLLGQVPSKATADHNRDVIRCHTRRSRAEQAACNPAHDMPTVAGDYQTRNPLEPAGMVQRRLRLLIGLLLNFKVIPSLRCH